MIKIGDMVITNNQGLGRILVKIREIYGDSEDERIYVYDYPVGENRIGWDYCKNAIKEGGINNARYKTNR